MDIKKNRGLIIFFLVIVCVIGGGVAMLISHYQSQVKIETANVAALQTERNKLKEKVYLAQNSAEKVNQEASEKTDSQNSTVVSSTTKINDLLSKFVSIMYANQDSNLLHRYEKMKPMLSGEALQQLKPASATPNTDNGQNAAKVSDVKTYISPADDEHIDVLTEYTLTSKVGDNDINSPMVLKVTVLNTNGAYSIDDFKTNSSFASNLSDRK